VEEVREYLRFRLEKSGYKGPEVFSGRAVKAIAKGSKGLARRVSILADKSLLAAYTDGAHVVKKVHVDYAVEDSSFDKSVGASRGWAGWLRRRPALARASLLGGLLIGLSTLYVAGSADWLSRLHRGAAAVDQAPVQNEGGNR
jgi:hypothetical protein